MCNLFISNCYETVLKIQRFVSSKFWFLPSWFLHIFCWWTAFCVNPYVFRGRGSHSNIFRTMLNSGHSAKVTGPKFANAANMISDQGKQTLAKDKDTSATPQSKWKSRNTNLVRVSFEKSTLFIVVASASIPQWCSSRPLNQQYFSWLVNHCCLTQIHSIALEDKGTNLAMEPGCNLARDRLSLTLMSICQFVFLRGFQTFLIWAVNVRLSSPSIMLLL